MPWKKLLATSPLLVLGIFAATLAIRATVGNVTGSHPTPQPMAAPTAPAPTEPTETPRLPANEQDTHSLDALGENIATILNVRGKLCARVISVEQAGRYVVVTCQEYRNDSSSRVRHVIEK